MDTTGLAPLLLSAVEVAHLLALSVKQVRRMGEDGRLPTVRVGRAVRFRRRDVVRVAEQGAAGRAGRPQRRR